LTYYNLANLLRDFGDFSEALSNFQAARNLNPNDVRASLNMAHLQRHLGKLEDAIKSLKVAICHIPFAITCLEGLGEFLWQSKDPLDSTIWYERALYVDPFNVNCLINLSNAMNEKEDRRAANLASRAICLNPQDIRAYVNQGISLQIPACPERTVTLTGLFKTREDQPQRPRSEQEQQARQALSSYKRALLLDPSSPEAHLNRAGAHLELNDLREALEANRIAIILRPTLAKAYLTHTLIARAQDGTVNVLPNLDHAIALDPEYADAQFAKAIALLDLGKLVEGWKLYKWRWRSKIHRQSYPITFGNNSWSLEKPPGRLWVVPEQGLGDQILFGRFLGKARKHTGSLLVSLDFRLIPIFARSFPEVDFLPEKEAIDEQFDWHAALGDLPGELIKLEPESDFRYPNTYLISDQERSKSIRSSIGFEDKLVCGISWQSNRKVVGKDKSASLEDLKSLLGMEEVIFINLQYGDVCQQITDLYNSTGIQIMQCKTVDNFKDIDGLASLIDACDLVVSTSNTTVHLSGALGKDTHVLLPEDSRPTFWYWRDRQEERSLWYPSCKLYPKDPALGWSKALDKIKSHISNRNLIK
jgi:tetratricopeptide (TPR) repeat protein